ncbi:MAG: alpha/beta hydrolase [Myxococcota bacterium]
MAQIGRGIIDPALDRPGPARLRPRPTPSVDEVEFSDLYRLEELPVDTEDGWRLVLTRYRPRPQPYAQPLAGAPLLLVHGYTQNRRAWSSGEFVKTMLYFGADLYLLELRGHGKSGVSAQLRRSRQDKTPLPADLDYGWDIDSHLLYDLPAAVDVVRRKSRRERIFFCGHSLGGILGYAYATLFDDLMGLITIGAPSDFARMPLWLRAVGWAPPLVFSAVDLGLGAINLGLFLSRALRRFTGLGLPARGMQPLSFRRLPFRPVFQWLESRLGRSGAVPLHGSLPFGRPLLYQPRNVALGALRPLLREGANDEPRATAEQFASWLRRGELISYRIRHDIAGAFPRIQIPLAIFFGDEDPLASVRTTRNVYRSASSDYLLWRPVRGNSHMDLTMGLDIRQICYDVKNLMTYALDHDGSPPPLRRRRRPRDR